MKEQNQYYADMGSLTLINKNGAKIHLANQVGDGSFKYYVFDTRDEFEKHLKEHNGIKRTDVKERIWLSEYGWKVMTYDCAKEYESSGRELDSNYITIYSYKNTFYFLLHLDVIALKKGDQNGR